MSIVRREEALYRRIAMGIGAYELAACDFDPRSDVLTIWLHVRPGDPTADELAAAREAFERIIRRGIERGGNFATQVGPERDGTIQVCLVLLKRSVQTIVGATAYIVRCRDREEAMGLLSAVRGDELEGLAA